MFWNLTVRRLGGDPLGPALPRTYGGRPDLETGERLLVVATEGGVLLARCSAPNPPSSGSGQPTPRFRSSVGASTR